MARSLRWWGMSKPESTISIPKSMRHKRILDAAEDNPASSIEELADNVPSATADLVENVLEEYGDPADSDLADTSSETLPTTEAEPTDTPAFPDLDALSVVQRETLQAIRENPDATQRELGDRLEVSPATVSNRVNAIPNFVWDDRTTIVATILDTPDTADDTSMTSTNGTETQAETERQEHSTNIEEQPATETHESSESAFDDPEFAYKILRACMDSEEITEDEERRLFTELHK